MNLVHKCWSENHEPGNKKQGSKMQLPDFALETQGLKYTDYSRKELQIDESNQETWDLMFRQDMDQK